MNNYKLTAITFPDQNTASDFIIENIDNWAEVEFNGVKYSHDIYPVIDQETYETKGYTVVYFKKVKKQIKELTRIDCNNVINEAGKEWSAIYSDGAYTLEHGRNGKVFKGIKAKSWRGLKTIIKNLIHENRCCSETEFLRKYEIINYR
jgi:hypothetical protein